MNSVKAVIFKKHAKKLSSHSEKIYREIFNISQTEKLFIQYYDTEVNCFIDCTFEDIPYLETKQINVHVEYDEELGTPAHAKKEPDVSPQVDESLREREVLPITEPLVFDKGSSTSCGSDQFLSETEYSSADDASDKPLVSVPANAHGSEGSYAQPGKELKSQLSEEIQKDSTTRDKLVLITYGERNIKIKLQKAECIMDLETIKRLIISKLQLKGDPSIRILYKDPDFNEAFVELDSTEDIFDKMELKVCVDSLNNLMDLPHCTSKVDSIATLNPTSNLEIPDTPENQLNTPINLNPALRSFFSDKPPEETELTASTESASRITLDQRDHLEDRDCHRNTWHLFWNLPPIPKVLKNALSLGILTASQKDLIINILYQDIYPRCNFYPKAFQYDHVINLLLKEYPKLSEGNLAKHEYAAIWKRKLRMKFKNHRSRDGSSNLFVLERKLRRSRVEDEATALKRQRLDLARGMEQYLPEYPPGENEDTGEKYTTLLIKLSKERSPDLQKVTSYMERSFAYRRRQIVLHQKSCTYMFENFPFLSDRAQFLMEYKRITGIYSVTLSSFKASVRGEFSALQKIYKQRKKATHDSRLKERFVRLKGTPNPDEYQDICGEIVLLMLPTLLREKSNMILNPIDEEMPAVFLKEEEGDYSLCIEGNWIRNIPDISMAYYIFMISFYIFNMRYIKGFAKTQEYIQRRFLKISDIVKMNPAVSNLISLAEEHLRK